MRLTWLKDIRVIIGVVLFVLCFALMRADAVGEYAVYDQTSPSISYDRESRKSYVNNVIRVTFEPLRIGGGGEDLSDYVGGEYFRDPQDKNIGFIVLPSAYTMAELTNICDDILAQYGWVSYAGYILK